MSKKRVAVSQATYSGHNVQFYDNYTGTNMSHMHFVDEINHGWVSTLPREENQRIVYTCFESRSE